MAGAYYATFKSGAFPSDFFFNFSVFLLCMVVLGGMGSVWGVVVGGLFLAYLDQEGLAKTGNWVSENVSQPLFDQSIDVPKYNFLVYGLIIVLVMLIRPTGLIPERRRAQGDGGGRPRRGTDRHDGMSATATAEPARDLLLDAEQIRKEFGGLVASNDVDFTIPRGSIVSLIGPNGAGKTTFFNMLTGAEQRHEIEEGLTDLYDALSVTTNPIPIKAALNLAGQEVGGLRLPLVEASEEEKAVIRVALERHQLLAAV